MGRAERGARGDTNRREGATKLRNGRQSDLSRQHLSVDPNRRKNPPAAQRGTGRSMGVPIDTQRSKHTQKHSMSECTLETITPSRTRVVGNPWAGVQG